MFVVDDFLVGVDDFFFEEIKVFRKFFFFFNVKRIGFGRFSGDYVLRCKSEFGRFKSRKYK